MPELQELCQRGQELLIATDYIGAEIALAQADRLATAARDWDTLSRLYMPLQEARRQKRQRCAEGIVKLDFVARFVDDPLDPEAIVERYPHGQRLVAGWNSIAPAQRVRELAAERKLYLETFLAIVDPNRRDIVVVPIDGASGNEIRLNERDLATANVSAMWERLHAPFLATADAATDPLAKIAGYRKTIEVDYACEFAHQRLSAAAQTLARKEQ